MHSDVWSRISVALDLTQTKLGGWVGGVDLRSFRPRPPACTQFDKEVARTALRTTVVQWARWVVSPPTRFLPESMQDVS